MEVWVEDERWMRTQQAARRAEASEALPSPWAQQSIGVSSDGSGYSCLRRRWPPYMQTPSQSQRRPVR